MERCVGAGDRGRGYESVVRVGGGVLDVAWVLVEWILKSTSVFVSLTGKLSPYSQTITDAEELEVDRNARNSALSDSLVLRKEISEPMVSARARAGICAGLTQRRWGRSVRRTWATRPLSHMLYSTARHTYDSVQSAKSFF